VIGSSETRSVATTNTLGRAPECVKSGRSLPLAPPVALDYPHRTLRLFEPSTLARRQAMASNSVYRVTDLVGTSKVSWEDAVKNAVQTAGKTLRELRVGEVSRLDVTIEKGKVTSFRARVNVSFKYQR
jgi:flavin-binding protein dodecin